MTKNNRTVFMVVFSLLAFVTLVVTITMILKDMKSVVNQLLDESSYSSLNEAGSANFRIHAAMYYSSLAYSSAVIICAVTLICLGVALVLLTGKQDNSDVAVKYKAIEFSMNHAGPGLILAVAGAVLAAICIISRPTGSFGETVGLDGPALDASSDQSLGTGDINTGKPR